jgi:hypothetical protein
MPKKPVGPLNVYKHIRLVGECFEFTGSKDESGYGLIRFKGKVQRTHRVIWIIKNGPIPKGMMVLHKCDNPPCCNPEHLFLGSQDDNMKDMVSKGRQADQSGERNGNSFLTKEVIKNIRKENGTLVSVAKKFGIGKSTVSLIRRGEYWA